MKVFYEESNGVCPKCKRGSLERIPRTIRIKIASLFVSNKFQIKAFKCDNCQRIVAVKTRTIKINCIN